jgi:hypothetical protein
MNDFDIKKFLTENKMTRNSRLLNEEFDDKVNLEPFQELLNKGSFDHSDLSDAIKASGIKGSDFEETLNGLGFDVEKESYTETNSGEIADFSVNHPNYTSKMAYVSFFGDEFNRVG